MYYLTLYLMVVSADRNFFFCGGGVKQALDAILAHVRASLQMYVETPSAMPPDTLKKY